MIRDEFKLDKTALEVVELTADSSELAYWLTQPPAARLRALELLRQVHYGYDPATARLQRVLELAELPRR